MMRFLKKLFSKKPLVFQGPIAYLGKLPFFPEFMRQTITTEPSHAFLLWMEKQCALMTQQAYDTIKAHKKLNFNHGMMILFQQDMPMLLGGLVDSHDSLGRYYPFLFCRQFSFLKKNPGASMLIQSTFLKGLFFLSAFIDSDPSESGLWTFIATHFQDNTLPTEKEMQDYFFKQLMQHSWKDCWKEIPGFNSAQILAALIHTLQEGNPETLMLPLPHAKVSLPLIAFWLKIILHYGKALRYPLQIFWTQHAAQSNILWIHIGILHSDILHTVLLKSPQWTTIPVSEKFLSECTVEESLSLIEVLHVLTQKEFNR
jgi:hypothetical protein